MLLNISDALTSEGKVEQKQAVMEADSFQSRMGEFRILEKKPIEFTLTNLSAGKARMEGKTDISFQAVCDRCLEDVEVTLPIAFDRVVYAPDHVEAEDADTAPFMEGYQLDVETLMHHEILENWPAKILCREDCKGVCPVCGKNLNYGECGCDTFVPDPRMAVIKDIFERNKEV